MTYVSGRLFQGKTLNDIKTAELALTALFLRKTSLTEAEGDSWDEHIRELSAGRNCVMLNAVGMPSIMVRVPAMTCGELITGANGNMHPAFIVGGNQKPEIFIGKYQGKRIANTVDGTTTQYAVSLRGLDPTHSLTFPVFDTAAANNGAGWHMVTNAEWAALALLCKKRGFMPRGNNHYGCDYDVRSEVGEPAMTYPSGSVYYKGRVLTGSGPASWTHDGTPFGVYDLNGNVWEWQRGMRDFGGEPQIIENNNSADTTIDTGASSALWKAIGAADGSLLIPDGTGTTEGSLKWERLNDVWTLVTTQAAKAGYKNNQFSRLAVGEGIVCPDIMKLLALHPQDATSHGDDYFYLDDGASEHIPVRGGSWGSNSSAGGFYLRLGYGRSNSNSDIGFRPAFVNL